MSNKKVKGKVRPVRIMKGYTGCRSTAALTTNLGNRHRCGQLRAPVALSPGFSFNQGYLTVIKQMPARGHHPKPVQSCPPPHVMFLLSPFYARLQNSEERQLSSSYPSVCPNQTTQLPPKRFFMKFDRVFFENPSRTFMFH
jgi:hypothetical protein